MPKVRETRTQDHLREKVAHINLADYLYNPKAIAKETSELDNLKITRRRRFQKNWQAEQQRQVEQRSRAEQGTASAPPLKNLRHHQTAAHLCRYSTVDSKVVAGQAVSVGQVVEVIAEMAWS